MAKVKKKRTQIDNLFNPEGRPLVSSWLVSYSYINEDYQLRTGRVMLDASFDRQFTIQELIDLEGALENSGHGLAAVCIQNVVRLEFQPRED